MHKENIKNKINCEPKRLKPLDTNVDLADQITALIKQQFEIKPRVVKFIFPQKKAHYIQTGNFRIQVNAERHPDVKTVIAKGKTGCFLCSENMPNEERGIMLDKNWTLYPNPSPYEGSHCVLVYDEGKGKHPYQIINRSAYLEKALDLIWQLGYEEKRPSFNLTFNSVGAAASSAHFHFQIFDCDLPITNYSTSLKSKRNIQIGRVVGYDATVLVIEGEYTNKNELISEIFSVLDAFNMAFIAYNILIKVIGSKIRTYIYPRSREYPDIQESGLLDIRFGTCEMSGMAIVYDDRIARNIKEEDFSKALGSTTFIDSHMPKSLDSAYFEITKVKNKLEV
ncbi:hypothetical protein C4544_05605 [candidate division WS5 bacterium]|uniref:GDP-D-glucose phosphorylase 1 n=1 Tax=candidate division WS5 bacterium TaxID=2093353 RepID=A0A419DAV4_9BACT|nr:MAG: hypothetical protein C4544_05605 [candidate division WS5 bacterium]